MRCRPEEEEDAVGDVAVDFNRKEEYIMPGFDRTGPSGMGPMTGGARGYCNPSQAAYGPAPSWEPGYSGAGFRLGMGRGRGFSRGRSFGWGLRPGYGIGRGSGRGFGQRRAYPARGGW